MSRKPRKTQNEPGINPGPAVLRIKSHGGVDDAALQMRIAAMQSECSTERAVIIDSEDLTPPVDPELLAIMLEPEAGENGIEFEIAETPRIRTGHYGDELLFNYWRDHDDVLHFADTPEQANTDRSEYLAESAA